MTGLLDRMQPDRSPTRNTPQGAIPHAHRSVYFAGQGRTDTPLYLGSALEPGMQLHGPAIIEEPTTTIVLYPHSVAQVAPLNNYLISIP